MFALIQNTKVVEIENSIFPVSEDLIWVACDSSITTDYFYINGEFKITDKSDEKFLLEKKNAKISQCLAYLSSTDWQIIRLSDPTSGESLKEGVADNRALARSLQDQIKACTTLEQVNAININFN
jgi:hypothetical protein